MDPRRRVLAAAARFDEQAAALVAAFEEFEAALKVLRQRAPVANGTAPMAGLHYQGAVLSALRKLPGIERPPGVYEHFNLAVRVAADLDIKLED